MRFICGSLVSIRRVHEMRDSGYPAISSKHLGGQRDDLHEAFAAQFAGDRPEDAGAYRFQLVVEQHGRIAIETDQRAVRPAHALGGAHHHRVVHLALLDLAARDRVTHRNLDDVADAGIATLGAAQHLDAHQFAHRCCLPRSGWSASGSLLHPPHSAARASTSTTRKCLVLEIGRHSAIRTRSPSRHSPFSSCACSRVERRSSLPYRPCWPRRSTSTVTVFCALLLVTRPSRVRVILMVSLIARLLVSASRPAPSRRARSRGAPSRTGASACSAPAPSACAG